MTNPNFSNYFINHPHRGKILTLICQILSNGSVAGCVYIGLDRALDQLYIFFLSSVPEKLCEKKIGYSTYQMFLDVRNSKIYCDYPPIDGTLNKKYSFCTVLFTT